MTVQREKADFRQIRLQCHLEGMAADVKVTTDKMRLQQVILSYQSNALKFTPTNGCITIWAALVRNEDQKQFLRVEVRDNGCGIKEEDQQKLFRLFGYLEETSSLNTQGIGLGLYITKMIVTQFGGEVECRSKVGEGSTFCLTFELYEQNVESMQVRRDLNPQQQWHGQKMQLRQATDFDPFKSSNHKLPSCLLGPIETPGIEDSQV